MKSRCNLFRLKKKIQVVRVTNKKSWTKKIKLNYTQWWILFSLYIYIYKAFFTRYRCLSERRIFFPQKGQSMFVTACHQYVRVCKQNRQRICFFFLSRGAISRKRKIPLKRNAKKKIAPLDRRDLFFFPFECQRGFTRAKRIRLREGNSSRGTALKSAQVFEAHEANCWKDEKAFG